MVLLGRIVIALVVLVVSWPATLRAQAASSPAWLQLPPLAEGWALRAVGEDRALVQRPGSEIRIVLGSGESPAAEALSHATIVAGRWVTGSLHKGEGPVRFQASVDTPKGALSVVVTSDKADGHFGEALEIVSALRVLGDSVSAPAPVPDLEGKPEARINPVGLFVVLPGDWRPNLNKKTGVFTLKRKADAGTLVFAKASAEVLRDLRNAERVAKAYPGFEVAPLYWRAPGAHRSWRLHKKKADGAVEVEELHLVRFKKLDDWSYHLIHVKGFTPATGMAPARAILSRVKLIP